MAEQMKYRTGMAICHKKRQAITARLSPEQWLAILFGSIGFLAVLCLYFLLSH